MTTLSLKVGAVLGSMRWQLLRFDEPLLAYSDQPVVVWPVGVDAFATSPTKPDLSPLDALEVRIPVSPQCALLMTWVGLPDVQEPNPASATHAAEMNALVIGQADKQ
jgi:hypothetical protein